MEKNTPQNPPVSCIECSWYKETYSPTTQCRTYWFDNCSYLNRYFAKMHIILRGEYRSLAKHDRDDLKDNLPYECPFFKADRVFWEMPNITKYDFEVFAFDCINHPDWFRNYYVYSLPSNIRYLMSTIPVSVGLHYMMVQEKDKNWFIMSFGERSVLLSNQNPDDWIYHPPVDPI